MGSEKAEFFGREQATKYDERWAEGAAIKDALHLLANVAFMELPANSNILCVGAGTGAEVLALAKRNPRWRFTALDTSEAMLEVCREKLDNAGLLPRCDFHHGDIESLPAGSIYQAATSILVSQFITKQEEREAFFETIKRHLVPEGYLLSADLARPVEEQRYQALMAAWGDMHRYNGLTEAQAKAATAQWNTQVAVSTVDEIETILTAAGFLHPLLVFQMWFIHAWIARGNV